LLSVIDVPILKYSPDRFQTENHTIDRRRRWSHVGTFPKGRLAELCDSPASLWENGYQGTYGLNDRVPEGRAINEGSGSLFLIRPSSLVLSREFEYNRFKVRAEFTYRGEDYRLAVTDPEILTALAPLGKGNWAIAPRSHLLCVSLGLPFDGFAYKLVAGVIGFRGV
jgi:hypothetical protein